MFDAMKNDLARFLLLCACDTPEARVQAIRLVRKCTPLLLREAKDVVEATAATMEPMLRDY